MDKLANILCEMDFELAVDNPKAVVKILIENAHETLSGMLGKHVSEIYQKDEKE